MYHYALRIDSQLPATKEFLTSIEASGFGVRETVDGANEHWHFSLRSDKKEQALRKAFLGKVSELRGNGGYSLALARDSERYDRYLCKGESAEALPEIVWSYGFDCSDERVKALHDEYWDERGPSDARKRKMSVPDTVLDICKQKRTAWSDRRKIAEYYIRELAARNKPINIFSVRSQVNSLQIQLCPDDSAFEELALLAASV